MYASLEEMTTDLEVKTKQWHKTYDEKQCMIEAEIDRLLSELNEDNLTRLIMLFEDNDVKTELRKTLKIGYMICVMSVFAQEVNAGEERCVLSLAGSIQEFVDLMMQIKFLLWRIEFENDQESIAVLNEFISVNSVSPQFIAAMVEYVNIDKNKVYKLLADSMLAAGIERHGAFLLGKVCI